MQGELLFLCKCLFDAICVERESREQSSVVKESAILFVDTVTQEKYNIFVDRDFHCFWERRIEVTYIGVEQ